MNRKISACAEKAMAFATEGRLVKKEEYVLVKRSCLLELHYELEKFSNEESMDERELATVLVALRYYQSNTSMQNRVEMDQFRIDSVEPLNDEQIDALCEKLNKEE
jgi:hypothetical protein